MFEYCITPQTTWGITPTETLMEQKPKTCLDLLCPVQSERVAKTGETEGETWNYPRLSGPVSVMFRLADGRVFHSVRFGLNEDAKVELNNPLTPQ